MDMTDVSVCTTGGFDRCVGALVCCIGSGGEECKAYPSLPFDLNIVDGRGVMCSVLTLGNGSNRAWATSSTARSMTTISRRSSCASSMARPAASWT